MWAVALFLDPEAQANQIREAVFRVASQRNARSHMETGALPIVAGAVDREFAEVEAAAGIDDLLTGQTDQVTAPESQQSPGPQTRSARPDVPFGLPMTAYGDNQLDALVMWIIEDGVARSQEDLAAEMRQELGIVRRSHRVDTAIGHAIDRALGRS